MTDDSGTFNDSFSDNETFSVDDRLAEVIDAVNAHTELLAQLAESVKKMEAGDVGPGGWTAFALDPARVEADQKRLDARMLKLRRWLQWAHPRLFVPSLPDPLPQCWPNHPGVVEELLALYAAWSAAYAGKEPGEAAIAWHDRWLHPCLHRIWTVYGLNSCAREGRHEDRPTVATADNGEMITLIDPATSSTAAAADRSTVVGS